MNQTSALSLLKTACTKKSYKSFNELKEGEYIVNNFTFVDTTYGKRVRISLEDKFMFLPERFAEILNDDTIAELNSSPKIMVYGGKDNKRLILDFKPVSYITDQFE